MGTVSPCFGGGQENHRRSCPSLGKRWRDRCSLSEPLVKNNVCSVVTRRAELLIATTTLCHLRLKTHTQHQHLANCDTRLRNHTLTIRKTNLYRELLYGKKGHFLSFRISVSFRLDIRHPSFTLSGIPHYRSAPPPPRIPAQKALRKTGASGTLALRRSVLSQILR